MQLTTLVFTSLLVVALFTGTAVILSDVATVYPAVAQNTTYIASMNRTLANLTVLSTGMTTDISKASAPEAVLGLAFGFLTTAFQAVVSLASMPAIIMDMASLMVISSGGIIPTWFLPSLVVALGFVFVTGLAYYLLKVK